ncbi:MAG: universal stress protein [Clostridia bacterium]|nr:universal stress protein [Clostridia bacterium]
MNQNECILVCVTVQKECGRLIEKGKALAENYGVPLHVLHVSGGKNPLGNPDAAEALNYLFSLAHEAEGEMNILYETDVPAAISRYAGKQGAKKIIMGADRSGVMAEKLRALLPEGTELICEGE